MDRNQLENIYLENGLMDFKLRTTDDLLKVHGIDFKTVDGYNRLDDLNKSIYENFIIKFFNGQGLEHRDIVPTGIYFVEEIGYLVKEDPSDDYFTVAGEKVLAIDRNGVKTVHKNWVHESYKGLEIKEDKPKYYLRFEYNHHNRPDWLHIVNEGKDWY